MRMISLLCSIGAVLPATIAIPGVGRADPIVAGPTHFKNTLAIQDIELLPNTPFNPTGDSILIKDFTGIGRFSTQRDAQPSVGADITFNNLGSAIFRGSHPLFGPFEVFSIGDYSGTISNVQQDPSDTNGDPESFLSGDWASTGVLFGLRSLVTGAELFTKDPTGFTGKLTSLTAPPPGTLLLSPEPITTFFTDPATGNDIAIGISTNRRLQVVVPEPSSLALVGLGAVFVAARLRRPRRQTNPRTV